MASHNSSSVLSVPTANGAVSLCSWRIPGRHLDPAVSTQLHRTASHQLYSCVWWREATAVNDDAFRPPLRKKRCTVESDVRCVSLAMNCLLTQYRAGVVAGAKVSSSSGVLREGLDAEAAVRSVPLGTSSCMVNSHHDVYNRGILSSAHDMTCHLIASGLMGIATVLSYSLT